MKTVLQTVIACCVFFVSLSLSAHQVKLIAEPGSEAVLAGAPRTVYLKISLNGLPMESTRVRAPVNVALVLDRSGSMSGSKIQQAREAATRVLDYLQAKDIFAVVTYASSESVLVPATKLTDKDRIAADIAKIRPGGSTALYAGVSKGAAEVRKFLEAKRVNRVILLSDGLANVGPQTPAALGQLGMELGQDGIAVTTLGLGLDYNEDLMVQLARKSDGNHAFVENTNDLTRIFEQEFGDVLSVVAQQVEVLIRCQPGVKPLRLLGREGSVQGQQADVRLSQLYDGQEKYILLELQVPTGEAQQSLKLANVEVNYLDMQAQRKRQLQSEVLIQYSDSERHVKASANREVMIAVTEQVALESSKEAVRLRDAGDVQGARGLLQKNAEYLKQQGKVYAAPKLERQSTQNEEMSESLGERSWKRSRKQMRKDQYSIEKQQKY
ncbi:vWA domain-containing protein [Candidatus Venteria ishoeyi]|uniref:von Willebrand factor type A domain protein n=1 Tax=Candidatus Venteria ishoeyi TaxID=1899563 RepID=A0A1H6FGG8_9GAMM|nr:VWA domain-containing protein [Candidatus Venteria ishoeyi]SEH08439.1 von Willebrand factor type A domain protein [Candidatus Venteria ishoeyi]